MNRSAVGLLVGMMIGSIGAAAMLAAHATAAKKPAIVHREMVTKPSAVCPPVFEPKPKIVRQEQIAKPHSLDPYDQLQHEIDAVTPGLTWSHRLDGIEGRMVRNAKNLTAVVVSSDNPKAIEKSARIGMKKDQDVYVRQSFIFIGDKALLDSIRRPPSRPS